VFGVSVELLDWFLEAKSDCLEQEVYWLLDPACDKLALDEKSGTETTQLITSNLKQTTDSGFKLNLVEDCLHAGLTSWTINFTRKSNQSCTLIQLNLLSADTNSEEEDILKVEFQHSNFVINHNGAEKLVIRNSVINIP
jgi:hypothetical protein